MVKNIFVKLIKDPYGSLKRALYKTTLGPFKYGKGNDYDARSYWRDRFRRYGQALRGVGDEGLSEEDNKKAYQEAATIFTNLCIQKGVNFNNVNVLEIGCGTGFYTQLLYDLGVKRYTGIDITDTLFNTLKDRFPQYTFIQKDVTREKIEGSFDLIIMIDVIEHIVTESKFSFAMRNVMECFSEKGIFILAPIMQESKRLLFHVRSHSLKEIKRIFSDYTFSPLLSFRGSSIVSIKRTLRIRSAQ